MIPWKSQGVNCMLRQEHSTDIDAALWPIAFKYHETGPEAIVEHAQP